MENEGSIKLIAETLKFYANEENYSNNQINLDKGHLARHSLDLINRIEQSLNEAKEAFDEYEKSIDDNSTQEDALKLLKEITDLSKK